MKFEFYSAWLFLISMRDIFRAVLEFHIKDSKEDYSKFELDVSLLNIELFGIYVDSWKTHLGLLGFCLNIWYTQDNVLNPLKTVTEARALALRAHKGQLYGTEPYIVHLDEVVEILRRFNYGVEKDYILLSAGFLHDVLEDTKTKYKKIKKLFGSEIADLVYAVTDEKGPNRTIRKIRTYPKIKKDKRAIILKLADRIANVEYSMLMNTHHLKMYQNEMEEFERELRIEGHASDMWEYLKRLIAQQ